MSVQFFTLLTDTSWFPFGSLCSMHVWVLTLDLKGHLSCCSAIGPALVLSQISSTPGCLGQEWSHWPRTNRNLMNPWAGAEGSYLISLQPKALAINWLLGYLLKTDTQMQGVYLCVGVCSSFSRKLPSPFFLNVCMSSFTAEKICCFTE